MPVRILKRSNDLTKRCRSPAEHWLIHLKTSTQPEPHNLLQSSGIVKPRYRFSIVHITRNLLENLLVGYKNFVKIAGKLNSMILLSNASTVYSELQKMREIVHESHECFSEYMRQYISQEILSKLEMEVKSVQRAMASIGNTSDYIDTRNRMIFTEDASQALKSHRIAVKGVQNLFEDMLTEACRVILSFMGNSGCLLLNKTIMAEILRHLTKMSHIDVVSKCLRKANAIPLFLKTQEEVFYQGLYHICRLEMTSCVILSRRAEELCRIVDQTRNETVLWHTVEILNLIVSRAAKSLNSVKPSVACNGIKSPDLQFDHSLYSKLPHIATTATMLINRETTANVPSIYHSTLRVISGIWRISTRLGKSNNEINEILSKCLNSLISKLNDYENKDSKTRHLTMMVIAMLAKSSCSREKLQNSFVIRRLVEILDDTHKKYVKAREEKESFVSGCIVDCETARSNSCESLVKNCPLSLTGKKQTSFASDCTLTKSESKLCDLSSWRKAKGSLPNLSSGVLSVKFSGSNGTLNDDTLEADYSAKFIQHILHNCAIALKRICADGDIDSFYEHGGMEVVNKILSCKYSNEAVIPYLKELQTTRHRRHTECINAEKLDEDGTPTDSIRTTKRQGDQPSPALPNPPLQKAVALTVLPTTTQEDHKRHQNLTSEMTAFKGPVSPVDDVHAEESDYVVINFKTRGDKEPINGETEKTTMSHQRPPQLRKRLDTSHINGNFVKFSRTEKDPNINSDTELNSYFTIPSAGEEGIIHEAKHNDVSDYVSSAEIANMTNSDKPSFFSGSRRNCKNDLQDRILSIHNNLIKTPRNGLFVEGGIERNLTEDGFQYFSPSLQYVVENNLLRDSSKRTLRGDLCSDATIRHGTTYIIKTTTSS